jgi:molecular chaperone GrpE
MEFFMRKDENLEATVEQPAPEGIQGDEGVEATQETPAPEAEFNKMKEELAEAQAKVDEYWQRVLRAQAEQDNMRKRAERDVENAHKYALERFATELLPVIDSLEMGLAAAEGEVDAEKIREGTELTLKMFSDVLGKFGIKSVDPMGEPFDPELHQAMTLQPSSEVPPDTVTAVMQKGYTLNDRLIRPAMVIVSKEP